MKRVIVSAAAALTLTGCAGLEMAHLAGQVIAQEVSTVAVAQDDVKMQDGAKVYPVEMGQRRPLGFASCKYQGVMVEYSRDWDEIDEWGHVVRAAEPDTSVGYALLLINESCPESEPQEIMKIGSKSFYPIWGRDFVIRKSHSMTAVDYFNLAQGLRPQWMPQVLNTIKEEAATNPVAANFFVELESRSDLELPL